MKKIATAVLSVWAALAVASCGSSDASGTGGGGGGGGMPDAGVYVSIPVDCEDYCTVMMANCLFADQQYPDNDTCMAVCASFPKGTIDDRYMDTLGCRVYALGFTVIAPDTKCAHAGPSGGNLRVGGGGICGDGCEAFCNLEQVACTGANEQYATTTECMTACQAFPGPESSNQFDVSDVSGDTFNCRLYHLTAAAIQPDAHCKHTKPTASGDPCAP